MSYAIVGFGNIGRAEALCGFKPSEAETLSFLRRLQPSAAGLRSPDRTVPAARIKTVAMPPAIRTFV